MSDNLNTSGGENLITYIASFADGLTANELAIVNLLATIILAFIVLWGKYDFRKRDMIGTQKYNLKYEACINALKIIDADFSTRKWSGVDKGAKVQRQWYSVEYVRECHSALILTCPPAIVELFNDIMFGKKETMGTEKETPPTVQLNKLRSLIKRELGFGKTHHEDKDRTWFACNPKFIYEVMPSEVSKVTKVKGRR